MPWNTHTSPPPHIHTCKINNKVERRVTAGAGKKRRQASELATMCRSKWMAAWFREQRRKIGNVSP